MSDGLDYCMPINTTRNDFFISTLEKLTKYWPGGSYLGMKSNPRVPGGKTIMNIGYRYSSREVI